MTDLMTKSNEVKMTSRDIAELTGKQHAHVMRDIKKEREKLGELGLSIFGQSFYINSQNKKQPMFTFGKKGAMQLALKYDAVTRFKVIEKIEELEASRQLYLPSYQIGDPIKRAEVWVEEYKEKEAALARVKALQIKNIEMKPKAEFFDDVAASKTAIAIGKVAKVLAVKGYGRNNLFQFLREQKVLMKDNSPYQKYIDAGYFNVIEQHYMRKNERVISFKTLVYQRGLDYIRRLIETNGGDTENMEEL